jgi:Zn-dependent M32 family carboxypeptidase
MEEQQKKWAEELKLLKQKTLTPVTSASKKYKDLKEALDYYGKAVLESAKKKDFANTKKYFTKIIEIKAEITASEIKNIKNKNKIDSVLKKYNEECVRLSIIIDSILGIKHNYLWE